MAPLDRWCQMRLPLRVAASSVLLLAAGCGGPSGPDKASFATTTVTLPSVILVGDVVQARVESRDASGNPVDGPAAWSSSNPSIASVSDAGFVTGVAVGGPVTIAATVRGQSGSTAVSVANDNRFGYAFADQETVAGPYAPQAALRLNSSGAAIQISRSDAGTYAVRFVGLGRISGQRDNVQVTGVGSGPGYCKAGGWQSTGTDLVVDVRCFTGAGQPGDRKFSVMVVGARALPGRVGFMRSNQPPGAGALDPATTHSSGKLGDVGIVRDATGAFEAFLGVPRVAGSGPEIVLVTAVGAGAERCMVVDWDQTAGMAQVSCVSPNGSGVDTPFSVLWIERGRPGLRTGFAWANEGTDSGDFTPDTRWSLNSSGGAILEQHPSLGQYRVVFSGLGKTAGMTEVVLVTVYGNSQHRCATASWSNTGAGDLQVFVNCFGLNSGAVDSKFDLLVIQ
jgi:hypothetical protein